MPKKVKFYSTPGCIYCKIIKDFLKKHNVEYEEFNVGEDAAAREEIIKESQQMGVPVVEINGEVFVGFDRVELAKALELKNK